MTLYKLMYLLKEYNGLGWAVQEQLDDVIDGKIKDCNPNAVRMIKEFFATVAAECDGTLGEEASEMVEEINAFKEIEEIEEEIEDAA